MGSEDYHGPDGPREEQNEEDNGEVEEPAEHVVEGLGEQRELGVHPREAALRKRYHVSFGVVRCYIQSSFVADIGQSLQT